MKRRGTLSEDFAHCWHRGVMRKGPWCCIHSYQPPNYMPEHKSQVKRSAANPAVFGCPYCGLICLHTSEHGGKELEAELEQTLRSRDGWRADAERENRNRDSWKARAERAEAREKELDWLVDNIPHPEEDIEFHPEWAARYERWKEAREREASQ